MNLRSVAELEAAARALTAVGAPHPAELTEALKAARAAETVGAELSSTLQQANTRNEAKVMAAMAEVCASYSYSGSSSTMLGQLSLLSLLSCQFSLFFLRC